MLQLLAPAVCNIIATATRRPAFVHSYLLCIFRNIDNMEFCPFCVVVLILFRSSREEHELCSSEKRNTTSNILDVLEAMFTFHFSVTQM
jgi:hypothetical protein